MARLQVGLGANDYQWLPDLLILDDGSDITTQLPTQLVYSNSVGDTVTVNGSGFAYSGEKATGGKISSIVVTNGADTLLTLDQLSDPLKSFVKFLLKGDSYGAIQKLFDGADQLLGSAERDSPGGFSPGNDTVDGKEGDDYVDGDEGKDQLSGGTGFDTLAYAQSYYDKSADKGIKLDVEKGTVKDPWGDTDHFSNFESYWGSKFDDKMLGSSDGDQFSGLSGKDEFNGKGSEFDLVDYSQDAKHPGKGSHGIKADLAKGEVKDGYGDKDTVKNIEQVRGTGFKDTFKGSGDNNDFQGLDGKDSYNGGKGFDFLNFSANNFNGGLHGVVLNVALGEVTDDGYGNKEAFKGMESFVGTSFGDTLIGSSKDDEFKGENGNDTMTGAAGADKFVFNPPPDSTTNHDTITDFDEAAGDKMALWKQDGFSGLSSAGGDLDPNEFVANAGGIPTTGAQHIVYDTSTGNLFLDPDGNATAGDQILFATLTGAPAITAAAFEVWT